MRSTKDINEIAKKLKKGTNIFNGTNLTNIPLKTNYIDKSSEETIELLKNPKKCEEQGLDWFLEMHVHGHLLNKKEE